ncbi:MAG: tRNA (adenosine(37)-N6)-threonylcarbamoyltransferase complex ATPase subunit type 1 TsaE [Candidatus Hydrogenedentota bacterium]
MGDTLTLDTVSAEATEALGQALAVLLPPGAMVALRGDLATGKTCLVRGMAAHCADRAPVHSPTFTLVNAYGPEGRLVHIDLYRLTGPEEVAALGYEELFEPEGVCVVEWADRAEGLLPARRLDIQLTHAGGDRRRIALADHGVLPPDWRDRLHAARRV